ncbi:peroxisome membrane protein [Globomyces pollinis-pini]|nr:peroxisome membrane protein [Globomyces pollinis-pini]
MTYQHFVSSQAHTIGSVESTLRSICYILPGRFKDAEILSESVYSSLKLIGHYHDSILAPEAIRQQPHAPTSFNRYTKALLKGFFYKKIAYLLTAIRAFSVVMEMFAAKRSKEMHEKVTMFIEVSRLICRLVLLKLSKFKMILHSQLPDRDYDITKLQPQSEQELSWTGKRTAKEHLSVDAMYKDNADFNPSMQYLLSKAMVEPSEDPLNLTSELTGNRLFGEYLYIFRPLAYLLAIRYYGKSSYKPWLLSLLLEVYSISTSYDLKSLSFKEDVKLLEQEEIGKRMSLWIYYLLRNPVYDTIAKPRLAGLAEWTSTKPLISIIGSVINDYTPLWENYHFYTTGF